MQGNGRGCVARSVRNPPGWVRAASPAGSDEGPLRRALVAYTSRQCSASHAADCVGSGSGSRRASRFERRGPTIAALTPEDTWKEGMGGISLGGILVIVGIVVAIFWSLLLGLIIALIGLIAFGGFARGKWY